MQIGMVGLGRMGGAMAERLRVAGHQVVGYDAAPSGSSTGEGRDVGSLAGLVAELDDQPRRIVWLMVPAGDATDDTVEELAELLDDGDLVVDGGNSNYEDSLEHADLLAERGIAFVDAGVSGGVWGREQGYALMLGGASEDLDDLAPVLEALGPDGEWFHVGGIGAGHFAKMVHNGVEYALMEAYAEGYELLAATDLDLDVTTALASWQKGSVVRSWLLDLLVDALEDDPELTDVPAWADDSGEGRWTVQEAVDLAVPVPAIAAALFARFGSRQDASPAMKVIAALRHGFGGHTLHEDV